jgi:hypothetical protein
MPAPAVAPSRTLPRQASRLLPKNRRPSSGLRPASQGVTPRAFHSRRMSRAFAKIADEVWDLGFGVVAAANGIGLGDPPAAPPSLPSTSICWALRPTSMSAGVRGETLRLRRSFYRLPPRYPGSPQAIEGGGNSCCQSSIRSAVSLPWRPTHWRGRPNSSSAVNALLASYAPAVRSSLPLPGRALGWVDTGNAAHYRRKYPPLASLLQRGG